MNKHCEIENRMLDDDTFVFVESGFVNARFKPHACNAEHGKFFQQFISRHKPLKRFFAFCAHPSAGLKRGCQ